MIRNYFRMSYRYLKSHRIFTAINLAGLAIGMSVCFFALLYVQFELSYDSFHEKSDRIYRVATDVRTSTGIDYKGTSPPMAAGILSTYPEVEAVTHIVLDYYLFQKDKSETSAKEVRVAYADSSLFSMFTFPLLEGNPASALNTPLTVVLSETLASSYFGPEDPIGKSVLLDGKYTMLITGVMKDIPVNSHIQADMLISMATLYSWNPGMENNWNGKFIFHSYVLLPEGYDPVHLSNKFPALYSLTWTRVASVTHYLLNHSREFIFMANHGATGRAASLPEIHVTFTFSEL